MSISPLGSRVQAVAWTPPALETLNFSTNCATVGEFYQAWFASLNDGDYYNWKLNITFYVPQSLPADVVENYFRGALPSNIDPVPSYGQILDWEHSLRTNYSSTVSMLQGPENTTSYLSAHFPYFEFVIEKPGKACWKSACTDGFSWDRLGDINGPGITASYYLQVLLATLFTFIVLWNAVSGTSYDPISGAGAAESRVRIKSTASEAVQKTIRGFQDTSVIFAYALGPSTGFLQGPNFHVKDSAIAIYVLLLALSVSFWLCTIRRCIRHIARGEPDRVTTPAYKGEWRFSHEDITRIITGASWIVITMLVFLWRRQTNPDNFDTFQNNICHFRATDRRLTMWIIITAAMFSSFLRILVVSSLPLETAKRYKSLIKFLDLVDMFLFAGITWAILFCYQLYKNHLQAYFSSDTRRESFNLGQALALASVAPILLYFVGPFYFWLLIKCSCAKRRARRQQGQELQPVARREDQRIRRA